MIKLPRGTQDILPDAAPAWRHVINAAVTTAQASGYEPIETPMFEHTQLFTHATGEHTDVNREMYTFEDRGGDNLSLRPEGTASVFRAYFEHGLHVRPQPVKLFYVGSMFRYERPQAGRFREHHQFGCEAIGVEDPLLDASLIELQQRFYVTAGLPPLTIHLNSIGDENCRPAYLESLVSYLRSHQSELCSECRERIERNALRVLDCKVPACQPVLEAAPRTVESLCDECAAHWSRVLSGLDALGIEYRVDSRLVRGLDYYTRTVWEFLPALVTGATSTIGGGGRYDALATAIGARPTPAAGFSTGLERVLLHLRPEVIASLAPPSIDVYGAFMGEAAELAMLPLMSSLVSAGLRAEMAFGNRSLKAQLKQADAHQARLALILGENELTAGSVAVRDLQSGEQMNVRISDVVAEIHAMIGGKSEK